MRYCVARMRDGGANGGVGGESGGGVGESVVDRREEGHACDGKTIYSVLYSTVLVVVMVYVMCEKLPAPPTRDERVKMIPASGTCETLIKTPRGIRPL